MGCDGMSALLGGNSRTSWKRLCRVCNRGSSSVRRGDGFFLEIRVFPTQWHRRDTTILVHALDLPIRRVATRACWANYLADEGIVVFVRATVCFSRLSKVPLTST